MVSVSESQQPIDYEAATVSRRSPQRTAVRSRDVAWVGIL
jgi:hypothetical protein